MLAALGDVVEKATAGFEAWDYTRSLEAPRRSSGPSATTTSSSSRTAPTEGRARPRPPRPCRLRPALETCCGCWRRFLPYVTEEVWSWWHDGSVHRGVPLAAEVATTEPGDLALLAAVGEALAGVRKAKSEAKVGMRRGCPHRARRPAAWAERVRAAEADLRAAGITGTLDYAEAETLEVRGAELIPVAKPKA